MIPLKFSYLVGSLMLAPLWAIIFYLRKDLRKEMLYMSFAVAVLGIFAEWNLWTVDWWHPQTITGTRIGIEDFFLGITNGGLAAVIYEVLFKKRLYKRKTHTNSHGIWILAMYSYAILYACFYFLHLTSFVSTILTFLIGGIIMVLYRRDLFIDALASGVLISALVVPFYWVLFRLSPGMVNDFWYTEKLSGLYFFRIPVEDLVFYFFVGFFVGPLYEFWQSRRLRPA